MLIYVQFYKKYTWWKVASFSYLGGVLVENAMNRSPIQIPTLMWVAFFIYPYFATKLWEDRKKIKFKNVFKDMKWAFVWSAILGILAWYATQNNVSPPLILLGIFLPLFIYAVRKAIR